MGILTSNSRLRACVAAALVVMGCHRDPARTTSAGASLKAWSLTPGLWKSVALDGTAVDVTCRGPKSGDPFWGKRPRDLDLNPNGDCRLLRYQPRADGFVIEGRCRTDFHPNDIKDEVRALGAATAMEAFTQGDPFDPKSFSTSHTRMTFAGACPSGWRVDDSLELEPAPESGRWDVERTVWKRGDREPTPMVVMTYRHLPPQLEALR